MCGTPGSSTFKVYNNSSDTLPLTFSGTSGELTLDTILARVNRNYTNITSLIPNIFAFTGGDVGNAIVDGGNNIYNGGNQLNTNFQSFINYSDNMVAPNTAFGVNGGYFTRKLPGLFVMGADLDNVSSFSITGALGAGGSGSSDGAVLTRGNGGTTYTGFINRTYNAFNPSVNRLGYCSRCSFSYSYFFNNHIF